MAGIETTRPTPQRPGWLGRWLKMTLGCSLALTAAILMEWEWGPRGQAMAPVAPTLQVPVALEEEAPPLTAESKAPGHRIFLGQVHIPTLYPLSDGQARTIEVPLLMYHYISPLPANADAIRQDLTIEPTMFARHLDRIQALGYQTVTIRSLVQHLNTGVPLPEKPIVLTFDDGYVDHYVHALPALLDRDMVGTFFIVSDFPDSGNRDYMDWSMVRIVARAGMEVESHARWHKALTNRTEAYLRDQAESSVHTFQQELGYRPRIISYPSGKFSAETIRVYRDTGYWAGITTLPGNDHHSDDLFRLRRVRLHGGDNPDRVEWLLSPEGNAWLNHYQGG